MDDNKFDVSESINLPVVKRPRRRYTLAQKHQMVRETLTGTESVSVVARRHNVNANQLFRWRSMYRDALPGTTPDLLPVEVCNTESMPAGISAELDFGNGRRLTISGGLDASLLRALVETLR